MINKPNKKRVDDGKKKRQQKPNADYEFRWH